MNLQQRIDALNAKIKADYAELTKNIIAILNETESQKNHIEKYFYQAADQLLFFVDLEQKYTPNFAQENELDDLKAIHNKIFDPFRKENYENSYMNHTYAINVFEDLGNVLAASFSVFFSLKGAAIKHHQYSIHRIGQLLQALYRLFRDGQLEKVEAEKLFAEFAKETNLEKSIIAMLESYSTENSDRLNFILNNEFKTEKDLYQFLDYVSDNEVKTMQFLATYSPEKIDILATSLAKAYKRGFDLGRKDIAKKETILIYHNLGQERIIKALLPKLEEIGLKPLITNTLTSSVNKQVNFDHRFDSALYMDEEYVQASEKVTKESHVAVEEWLKKYSGPLYFDKFGETPFSPESKSENLSLSEDQQKLSQKMMMLRSQLRNQYMSRKETSFCIVGFPTPEIGEKFEQIFEDTLDINMMDTERYEEIQQKIVDVLDKAEYVHVKGKNGNKTDVKVAMHKLENPEKQTNFVNCGADVNIPVGEVFTSPVLKGTNGMLHLKETFLNGLNYKDLEIEFKDGYVGEYNCANFEKAEEGKKYIQENLLFPHKTLPLGEFAIGTNTKAYVMAQKYDILNLLPILIVEKMGPHFAIGDTCFSWEEDWAVFNPIDGKEITARDNEHSAMRTEDVSKAYTNCHTDITLPYEDLDFIVAVSAAGEQFDILRDGRFVVPGTEALNEPFDA